MPEGTWDERDWTRLVDQLRIGDCTPFIGADATGGASLLGAELARDWADEYGYPFDDDPSFHDILQYVSVIEGDRVTVSRRAAERLAALSEPKYEEPDEPHTLLAEHPIRVHLTTAYDDFMTRALVRSGKQPTTAICPWYEGAQSDPETALPPDYQPKPEEPLVYHLHGSVRHPESLVLSEQDHIEFVAQLAKDVGADTRRVVPTHVLFALTRQPLLFIGYSLRDWSFRVLFHGFIEPIAKVRKRRHISVQLAPETDTGDPEKQERALRYLTQYFEKLNISIYWGSANEFCAELRRRLETP